MVIYKKKYCKNLKIIKPRMHARPNLLKMFGQKWCYQTRRNRSSINSHFFIVGHGGFNPKMLTFLDQVGVVHRITSAGDVRVQFPGQPESNFRWTINPRALKIAGIANNLAVGFHVKLIDDLELIKNFQVNHGGWATEMNAILGDQVGRVIKIYPDGDVRVSFSSKEYTFNSKCLKIIDVNKLVSPISVSIPTVNSLESLVRACAKGDFIGFSERLSSMENIPHKTISSSLQAACQNGHLEIVKSIINRFPDSVKSSNESKTPLQMAAHGGHVKIIRFLLSDPKRVDLLDSRDDEG